MTHAVPPHHWIDTQSVVWDNGIGQNRRWKRTRDYIRCALRHSSGRLFEDLSLAGAMCHVFTFENNQRRIGPCQTI
jgi:hypothetical protein